MEEEKEIWKKVVFSPDILKREKYMVSNLGKIKSMKVDKKNGKLIKLSPSNKGFYPLKLRKKAGKKGGRLLHRIVAEAFVKKNSEAEQYVIHKDHDKTNNRASNLKWATKEECVIHYIKKRKTKNKKNREIVLERLKKNPHLNLDTKYGLEEWKFIKFDDKIDPSEKFQISNYGRIISYKTDKVNGKLQRVAHICNFQAIHVKQKTGKKTGRYIHKLVAEHFIFNPDLEKTVVIHLDYDKENNHVSNLKWATKQESLAYHRKSPNFNFRNTKLTESQVIRIKKKLANPNRKTRMKMIAKEFGISDMQLWRIKSGENWSHVKI